MSTEGLLFQLEARPGAEDEVAAAFDVEVPAGLEHVPLYSWEAVRFDLLTFGLVALFDDRTGQEARVGERIAAVLRDATGELLEGAPLVRGFDVLAGDVRTTAPSRR